MDINLDASRLDTYPPLFTSPSGDSCIVLQLPMRKSSRQVVFVNTSPPEDGVKLLKCLNNIKEMEDGCEGIYT